MQLARQSCQAALNFSGLIQNLNHLSITNINDNELGSILLLNLGQVLPIKLDYLCLDLIINKKEDFEIFLKNSQNTFIEKLLIRNQVLDGHEIILPYIKEYIMKKKKVKYLAVNGLSSLDYLRDKKEFKLHNITVLDYAVLIIKHCDFFNEIYKIN
jgi:hypothetical protein